MSARPRAASASNHQNGSTNHRTPSTIDTAFEHLLGRKATDAERLNLRTIQEKLGIGSNDAIWLFFVALEYYRTLYERVPSTIRGAAEAILIEYKVKADDTLAVTNQQLEAIAEQLKQQLTVEATQAQQKLAHAITQSAHRITFKALRTPRWPWVIGGATSMALALLLGIGVAVGYGRHEGYARGYTEGYTVGLNTAQAPEQVQPQLR